MDSAEGSGFSGTPSPSIENQQPIQERGARSSSAGSPDRSDQDTSHRGGGKWKSEKNSNFSQFPTMEELETHSQRFEPNESAVEELNNPTTVIEQTNTVSTAESSTPAQPRTDENVSDSIETTTPVPETPVIAENGQITYPENTGLDPLTTSAGQLIAETKAPGDKLGDLKLVEQKEHALGNQKYKIFTDESGRNIELTPEQELDYAKGYLEKQNTLSTEAQQTTTPEKLEDDIRYRNLLEKASLDFLKTEDAHWFESKFSGEVSPNGYLIDNQGNETNFLPSQNISGAPWGRVQDRAKQEFAKLYPDDITRYQNHQVPTKTEKSNLKPEDMDKLVRAKEKDNFDPSNQSDLMNRIQAVKDSSEIVAGDKDNLLELMRDYVKAGGNPNDLLKQQNSAEVKAPEEKPDKKVDLNSKVKLTPSEMEHLIAEKQREQSELLDQKINKFVGKADSAQPAKVEEKSEKKSNRVFSAAEVARAKVAEVVRAAALKTPGGKFIYNSAERYLNNFDWRDKDKVAWGTGIVFGFGTNTALNMALPGVGSLINSVGTTAATHALAGGINRLRLRGIEKAIKFQASKLGTETSKMIDTKAFRDQYDAASRLLRSNGQEAYQAEMDRVSTSFLEKLGYKDAATGNLMMSEMISDLNQELQSKIFKYSKANERIRSFAAGMKVGAITNGLTNQFFDLDKYVEGKVGLGDSTPGLEATQPLSQEQIDLINKIHEDPEAWKTFTSLTPEQWQDVGRLYFAEQNFLTESGAKELIENLTNADTGTLVEIHQGDTVANLFQNNGLEVSYTPADSDLIGGHILANYELLADTHDRLVDVGVTAGEFPTKLKVIELIETARAGDTAAFHELQSNLDWLPVNEKVKLLSPNDVADIANFFEKKVAGQVAEEIANQ